MPTQPCANAAGARVPGTTWVIGQNLGWNKDPLMNWANREGLAGRSLKDSRGSGRVAANIGTQAHDLIEAYILGGEPEERFTYDPNVLTPLDARAAWTGYQAFRQWHRNSAITILGTELYGVAEKWQTGWCIDALASEQPGGEGTPLQYSLLDWKSSKGTYVDHFIQVSAYTVFVEEKLGAKLHGAHVVRVDKESGGFSHKFWPRAAIERGWAAFTFCRSLHEMRWELEKFVK